MRLTILVENTVAHSGLLAEHGLAMWLELGARRILFDTGQTDILCRNAERLGVDLGDTDALVLSHGHYDHTGGLAAVLQRAPGLSVYAHPDALTAKFSLDANGTARAVGISAESAAALLSTAVVVPATGPLDLGDGLGLTGPIPRRTDHEGTGGAFFLDREGHVPDDLKDDQAAFLDTPSGVVVLLGCAHAGLVNTLWYIREFLPNRPIRMVVGGTHLVHADETRLARTVDALRELGVQRIHPLHCTGFAAAARLWRDLPGRVELCPVGSTLDV